MPFVDYAVALFLRNLLLLVMYQMGRLLAQSLYRVETNTVFRHPLCKYRQVSDEYTNQTLVYPKWFVSSGIFSLYVKQNPLSQASENISVCSSLLDTADSSGIANG